MVRGDEEETELWSETMDGGSREGALEVSEKAGDVKGASTGRLRAGRVYRGASWWWEYDEAVEQDSLREGADDCVQEVKGLSWEMEENRERMMGLLASEARW
jgi:hypothetical protein